MSVVAIARDVGSAHHNVLHVLGEHLQVVWGALLALAIVVLLTPAVGGMARLLGVVDAPGGRRLNRSPVPRLGGLALFLGIFVPALAFLPFGRETRGLLLGAAIAVTVGIVDDFRGLPWFAKLGPLLDLSEPGLQPVHVRMARASSYGGVSQSMPVEPGEQEVAASIVATFALAP